MGTDFGDYDNDGWLDITKSNFSFESNNLYHNEHDGHFVGPGRRRRASSRSTRTRSCRWGTKFLDYDNDGWKDVIVANGHVYPYLRNSPPGGETYDQRRLLFRNLGNGKFADVSNESGPGIREERSSRGLAIGDLDNDGDLDVVIVNIDGTPSILRNDGGNARNWLTLRLRGTSEQPARAGSPRRGPLGGADAGGRSDHQREHLLGQRLAGALRPGRRDASGPRDPLAERQGPDASRGPGEPDPRGGRESRNRGYAVPIGPVKRRIGHGCNVLH